MQFFISGFFHLMFLIFIHVLVCIGILFPFVLSRVPLYGYIKVRLSIYQLMGMWL